MTHDEQNELLENLLANRESEGLTVEDATKKFSKKKFILGSRGSLIPADNVRTQMNKGKYNLNTSTYSLHNV